MNRLMQIAATTGVVLMVSLALPRPARAQTPAARDGQHDFDFNIGVWHTHISRVRDPFADQADTVVLDGTVTVRKVWGGKAELEEIEADGQNGHWEGLTLFLYNPTAHQWTQSFANSRAGVLTSNVGGFQDGKVVLVGQDNAVYDKTILVRAAWSEIAANSHRYDEWYSNDGGVTWMHSFTAHLTRVGQ